MKIREKLYPNDLKSWELRKDKNFEVPPYPIPNSLSRLGIKRVFDICFSLGALLLASPLFLLIGLLVSISSRSFKVIYSHERVGRHFKPFRCYKFRTMRKDAEEHLRLLLQSDPLLRKEWEENQKLRCDPRVTFIGKFFKNLPG